MTREQFEAALTQPPQGKHGEAVFDFSRMPNAPCPSFRYKPVRSWDRTRRALDECWEAYLSEFEADWDD